MNLLHLAHTVPFPPNKGEKIRAFHQICALSRLHDVHVACFARDEDDVRASEGLKDVCASVHVEVNAFKPALCRAALRFLLRGASLNMAFFESPSMRKYVAALCSRIRMDATVAYSLPMAPYSPPRVPILLDMLDVDSQKWLEYSSMRRPRILFKTEMLRLRQEEVKWVSRVHCTYLTSHQETSLLRSMVDKRRIECIENGVDLDYFNPGCVAENPHLKARRFVVFVGTMDYFPNIDGARWFAREVFPKLRRKDPTLEFLIVGNRPTGAVRTLASVPGVVVCGGVDDVRPYITNALAVTVPLRIARGIQNKVLESLALGQTVFTTGPVCRTLGSELPPGVVRCNSAEELAAGIRGAVVRGRHLDYRLREGARKRFSWNTNLRVLIDEVAPSAATRSDTIDKPGAQLCRKVS